MKRLEQYIPIAVDTVEDLFLSESGKVQGEYENLVSKFGVALRQLGLRTTLMAYSRDSDRAAVSRKKVLDAIQRIIEVHETGVCDPGRNMLDLLLIMPNESLLKKKVTDAAIALKLALRLFIEEDQQKPMQDE
jgi:CRISPR/Cas system CMR-associated protein Cmr5 small subunit